MCSICGIVDFKTFQNIEEQLIQTIGKTMIHRGPDQQGVFVNKDAALQHNRLAIIDIEKGLQPMRRAYEGETYTLVYNGELYNTQELREEIKRYGIQFETHCDTEVVLYAYILFKEECVKKLNGIFAFAVLEENRKRLYVARDRFGVKPFFYTQVGGNFLFASEIKALLKHPQVSAKVDYEGLWQLLYLLPVKIEGTSIFKGIKELPPASCGYYESNRLVTYKYWELQAEVFSGTEKEAVARTRDLVTDAIKRQLVSDAPLCTFLSGGLDSSIISSVAAGVYKDSDKILNTYSFEYEDNKQNFKQTLFQPQSDDEYARYLANYLGTNHTVLTATTEDIVRLLVDAERYRDLPGMADIDSSLLYYCQQVKKQDTVALSGECADEVFGGYPWFYRKEMLEKDFFPWIHDPRKRVDLFQTSLVKADEGERFVKAMYRQALEACPVLDTDTESMRQSRLATWLSTKYFMTSLLERKDRMSMASGVEVRVPFADHRILEYVFNVPWEIKFKGQVEKSLLREAMAEYLPDRILNRKKSPYPKTHNPAYEQATIKILQEKLSHKDALLTQLINRQSLEALIQGENVTWFGQLMSRPQLIAWLVQLDDWFNYYKIDLDI